MRGFGAGVTAAGVLLLSTPVAAQTARAQDCDTGAWTVSFDFDSDVITPKAAATLDAVAVAHKRCAQAEVTIAGHTDRKGDAQYNVGLSQRMAMNVRSYLAGRGLPDGVMTTQAFGESRPLVKTGDEIREPRNRRVEIRFGAGNGW